MIDFKTLKEELFIEDNDVLVEATGTNFKTETKKISESIQKADRDLKFDVNCEFGVTKNKLNYIPGNKLVCNFALTHEQYLTTKLSGDWEDLANSKEVDRFHNQIIKKIESWGKSLIKAMGNTSPTIKELPHRKNPYDAVQTVVYGCQWEDKNLKYKFDVKFGWKNLFTYSNFVWDVDPYIVVEITGPDVDETKEFNDFTNFVPGKILHVSWGYNMILNNFYEIIKRSGKTIYTRELETHRSGDGMRGDETPIKGRYANAQIFRSILKDNKLVKIGNEYASVWDGKPKHYDSMD